MQKRWITAEKQNQTRTLEYGFFKQAWWWSDYFAPSCSEKFKTPNDVIIIWSGARTDRVKLGHKSAENLKRNIKIYIKKECKDLIKIQNTRQLKYSQSVQRDLCVNKRQQPLWTEEMVLGGEKWASLPPKWCDRLIKTSNLSYISRPGMNEYFQVWSNSFIFEELRLLYLLVAAVKGYFGVVHIYVRISTILHQKSNHELLHPNCILECSYLKCKKVFKNYYFHFLCSFMTNKS